MEITLTVILIALVSALIGLVLVVVRRLEPAGEEHRTKAAFEESPGELELSVPVVRSQRSENGRLTLRADDRLLATIDLEPAPAVSGVEAAPAGTTVTAAVLELSRTVPGLLDTLASTGFQLTFSRDTLRGLAEGSLRMMSGDYALAVDAATARIVEVGKIGRTAASRLSASWPQLLAGGTAIAAAAVQQHQLEAALSEINAGIEEVYQRQIDDDSGRLHAASYLVREAISAAQEGPIPAQMTTELAVARREVEGIYFARREQMRRFIEDIEKAQDQHEAKHGQAVAWAKGVKEAFGNPAHFHADALAFIRSAAVKAHLAAGAAAAIAADGRPDFSFALLQENEDLLRADVLNFQRRINTLAAFTPSQLLRRFGKSDEFHAVVESLRGEIDHRIKPLLPLRAPDTIALQLDPAIVRREIGASPPK